MLRRSVAIFFLIGFIYTYFHDIAFYFFDPCMSKVETVVKFEKGKAKDPLCKIHHELHQVFHILPVKIVISQDFKENYIFSYQKPLISLFTKNIFKPPKQLI